MASIFFLFFSMNRVVAVTSIYDTLYNNRGNAPHPSYITHTYIYSENDCFFHGRGRQEKVFLYTLNLYIYMNLYYYR